MKSKKTLREVFEFFPNAKWITQDECGCISIYTQSQKPHYWGGIRAWIHDNQLRIYKDYFVIDQWPESMINWKQRCVSREEVMNDQKQ
jgi:hypothetical protein